MAEEHKEAVSYTHLDVYKRQRYSLHLFRHTFITESVKSGMPIVFLKRITGHSSFTQLNRYYQYNPTDLVDVVDEYNPLETLTIKRKVF